MGGEADEELELVVFAETVAGRFDPSDQSRVHPERKYKEVKFALRNCGYS